MIWILHEGLSELFYPLSKGNGTHLIFNSYLGNKSLECLLLSLSWHSTHTLMQSKRAIIPTKHHLLPLSQWGACFESRDHQYAALFYHSTKSAGLAPFSGAFWGDAVAPSHVCMCFFMSLCVSSLWQWQYDVWRSSSLLSQRTGGSLQRQTDNTLSWFNVQKEKKENGTIVFLFSWKKKKKCIKDC